MLLSDGVHVAFVEPVQSFVKKRKTKRGRAGIDHKDGHAYGVAYATVFLQLTFGECGVYFDFTCGAVNVKHKLFMPNDGTPLVVGPENGYSQGEKVDVGEEIGV